MKILEIIPTLGSGGAEKFVVELSNELAQMPNMEVHLLTFYNRPQDIFRELVSDKVIIHTFNKTVGFSFNIYIKLYKLIKEINPNVVHTHINAFNYLPISFLFHRKVKFFHTVHSDAYKEAGKLGRFLRKISFKLHLSKAIAISENTRDSFRKCYKEELPIVENGCSSYKKATNDIILQYKLTDNTQVLVNVARILELKNQVMLAKVCSKLIQEGFDIVLLIIGRIIDRLVYNQLCNYIDNLRIIYVGEVMNPRDYMNQADFYCLSSIYEGLPISLLETFSVSCIPVCTPVGGIVNVIKNERNGFLSEDLSEESYYKTLKKALMLENEKKLEMKSRIKEDFEDYTMKKCAVRYLDLFLK